MKNYVKKIFTSYLLTCLKKGIISLVLKFNIPIVSEGRVLPMARKKGIITLTLVISRVSKGPAVTHRAFVMFNFFRFKTKFQLQIDEYVAFKALSSPFIAKDQKEILENFTKELPHLAVSEVTLKEIEAYHHKLLITTSPYTSIKNMQAIRAFLRFHKVNTNIQAKEVTNTGIKELQTVPKTDIIPLMITRKVGRPANIVFIKKVKRLVDREGMTLRAIARAENKRPSNIHRAYHYNLDKVA